MFINPVVLGAGTPYFPDGQRIPLDHMETRTFGNPGSPRVVYVRYGRS